MLQREPWLVKQNVHSGLTRAEVPAASQTRDTTPGAPAAQMSLIQRLLCKMSADNTKSAVIFLFAWDLFSVHPFF